MKEPMTIQIGTTLAGLLLAVAASLPAVAADLNVPAQFPTIQAAVDAGTNGDTIHITPGVYTEQITISNKNLTLAGVPGAVIRAFPGMEDRITPQDGVTEIGPPLLYILFSDVVVNGLSFEGENLAIGPHSANALTAIHSLCSGLRLEGCSVSGFHSDDPLSGSDFGVYAYNYVNPRSAVVNVVIRNCHFADNETSIQVFGDGNANFEVLRTMFAIQDNIINGYGPTATSAQAGIAIYNGASGAVKGNSITDHSFTGGGLTFSSGISADLRTGLQAVRYEGNTFQNNQINLGSYGSQGSQFVCNTFLGPGTGYRSHGLVVSGKDTQILSNRFSNLPTGILLLGNDPDFGTALGIATNATLIGNLFCDVATPVNIEPLVTGTTNQGTLVCPFPDPTLSFARAIVLTWPDYTDDWILESAPSMNGPWATADVTPILHKGQNTVAVTTDSQQQFFRLRKP